MILRWYLLMTRDTKINFPAPLTVVIATLGDECLKNTIKTLNQGLVIPHEILVAIPENESEKVLDLPFDNVKIIFTKCRGQVQQRLEAFKQAKYDFVLQLDDDVEIDKYAIKIMGGMLSDLGPGNVIGPSFYDPYSLKSLHNFDVGFIGFLKSLNAFIFSAASWGVNRQGKISHIGIGFGVDPKQTDRELHQVDWLPGGCVLNYKQDLIMENYFPLPGKAFAEDIIHSLLRSSRNINHFIAIPAIIKTGVDEENHSWKSFKTELKARLHVVKLLRGNRFRLVIWGFSQLFTRKFKIK
jgi:glycosyltransferase involved in cell wall biosynthesis